MAVGEPIPGVSVPLRGKEGAGRPRRSPSGPAHHGPVSVPLRGKEGAGPSRAHRVRSLSGGAVSVPLRGKEGAGLNHLSIRKKFLIGVSVPLRGKEGAGHDPGECIAQPSIRFPSPCGVRRVRDFITAIAR